MTTNTTSPALYIKNGVLMTPHGECASAPASAILALVASQSARIAELESSIHEVLDAFGQRGSHPRRRTLAALLAKVGG